MKYSYFKLNTKNVFISIFVNTLDIHVKHFCIIKNKNIFIDGFKVWGLIVLSFNLRSICRLLGMVLIMVGLYSFFVGQKHWDNAHSSTINCSSGKNIKSYWFACWSRINGHSSDKFFTYEFSSFRTWKVWQKQKTRGDCVVKLIVSFGLHRKVDKVD